MANCSGVQPGGSAALACLQKNTPKLSPSCQQAVKSIGGAAATAAAAPTAASTAAPSDAPAMPTAQQQSAIQRTCRADFMRNCRGVPPGGPEALACLQRNAARLSPDCKTSVADIGDTIPAAAAAAAATTPVAAAPAAAAARRGPPGILPAGRILRRLKERAN